MLKKAFFLAIFGVTLQKNFKWLPIGQFWSQKVCLWLIWKLMSQIFQNSCGIGLNLWVLALSKVRWSRIVSAKMSTFRAILWKKIINTNHFDYMNPPQVLYMVGKLCISVFKSLRVQRHFFQHVKPHTSGQDPSLILTLCHKLFWPWKLYRARGLILASMTWLKYCLLTPRALS